MGWCVLRCTVGKNAGEVRARIALLCVPPLLLCLGCGGSGKQRRVGPAFQPDGTPYCDFGMTEDEYAEYLERKQEAEELGGAPIEDFLSPRVLYPLLNPGLLPEIPPSYHIGDAIFPSWGYPLGRDNLAITEGIVVWDPMDADVRVSTYDLATGRSATSVILLGGCQYGHNFNPRTFGNLDGAQGLGAIGNYQSVGTRSWTFDVHRLFESGFTSLREERLAIPPAPIYQPGCDFIDFGPSTLSCWLMYTTLQRPLPFLDEGETYDPVYGKVMKMDNLCDADEGAEDCHARLFPGQFVVNSLGCSQHHLVVATSPVKEHDVTLQSLVEPITGLTDVSTYVPQPREIRHRLLSIPSRNLQPEIPLDIANGYPLDCEWPWLLLAAPVQDSIQFRAVNLETKSSFDLTDNRGWKISGRLDSGRAVYSDNRNGGYRVYLADLGDRSEKQVTEGAGNQAFADIEGDRVVWVDDSRGQKDIWGLSLSDPGSRRCITC